jgi:hypothetical protein
VVISLGIMEKTWEIMSFFFFGYGRIIGIKWEYHEGNDGEIIGIRWEDSGETTGIKWRCGWLWVHNGDLWRRWTSPVFNTLVIQKHSYPLVI